VFCGKAPKGFKRPLPRPRIPSAFIFEAGQKTRILFYGLAIPSGRRWFPKRALRFALCRWLRCFFRHCFRPVVCSRRSPLGKQALPRVSSSPTASIILLPGKMSKLAETHRFLRLMLTSTMLSAGRTGNADLRCFSKDIHQPLIKADFDAVYRLRIRRVTKVF
jgi:hypothetical protein